MPLIKEIKKSPNTATYLNDDENWIGAVIQEEIGPDLGFWAESQKNKEQIYMRCKDFVVTKDSVTGIGECLIQSCEPNLEGGKCTSYSSKSVKLANLKVGRPRFVDDFCEEPGKKSRCAEPMAFAFFTKPRP